MKCKQGILSGGGEEGHGSFSVCFQLCCGISDAPETTHVCSIQFDECGHMYMPGKPITVLKIVNLSTIPESFLRNPSIPLSPMSRQPLMSLLSSRISVHVLEAYTSGSIHYDNVLVCLSSCRQHNYFEIYPLDR